MQWKSTNNKCKASTPWAQNCYRHHFGIFSGRECCRRHCPSSGLLPSWRCLLTGLDLWSRYGKPKRNWSNGSRKKVKKNELQEKSSRAAPTVAELVTPAPLRTFCQRPAKLRGQFLMEKQWELMDLFFSSNFVGYFRGSSCSSLGSLEPHASHLKLSQLNRGFGFRRNPLLTSWKPTNHYYILQVKQINEINQCAGPPTTTNAFDIGKYRYGKRCHCPDADCRCKRDTRYKIHM